LAFTGFDALQVVAVGLLLLAAGAGLLAFGRRSRHH
jgi:LPXTG-motif cell wall-anchored protein